MSSDIIRTAVEVYPSGSEAVIFVKAMDAPKNSENQGGIILDDESGTASVLIHGQEQGEQLVRGIIAAADKVWGEFDPQPHLENRHGQSAAVKAMQQLVDKFPRWKAASLTEWATAHSDNDMATKEDKALFKALLAWGEAQ